MSSKFQFNKRYHSDLRRINWDFDGSKGEAGGAHYHWYPARYVPDLPGILINYFSAPGERVLDPFTGTGTTLVEAYKFGRYASGIDINPVAIVIAKARLTQFVPDAFATFKGTLLARVGEALLHIEGAQHLTELGRIVPNLEENRAWYALATLKELAAIWTGIRELSESPYYYVAVAAFSGSLKKNCSQEKHWGWVCDNVKPGSLVYKPAIASFINKLEEYQSFAVELQQLAVDLQEHPIPLSEISAEEGDCATILSKVNADTYDLVVTSPPYLSVTDYVKSQRLSNLWLDFDVEHAKKTEIGARYRRTRKSALDEYLQAMKDAFREVYRVLKPDRFCCIVLGESPTHTPYIEAFLNICLGLGFDLDDRLERTLSNSRRLVASVRGETILILKK